MQPQVLTRPGPGAPYQRLDSVWMSRVRRSGWQGWTLLAGGDDVMDQSILFWQEGKGPSRSLSLTLRVRQGSDRKVRDALSGKPRLDMYRGSIPYPRKQIVAGEVHPLDRQWALMAGTALDVQIDARLRIRYLPYEDAASSDVLPYSAQGCLTVVLEGAQGHIDEVTPMLLLLRNELGLDTRLSTAADLEMLYLRKVAWAMRVDLDTLEQSASGTPKERLEALRAEVSRALSVDDVTRVPGYSHAPHFGTAFNPWTSTIGAGEAGWPHWFRFDVEPLLQGPLGSCFLGHDLAASPTHVADRVARVFRSTGHLLSAEERWLRLGTPSQSIHLHHGQRGAGAYLPLRLIPDDRSASLVFDIRLLQRADAIALDAEAGAPSPQNLTERLPLDALHPDRPCGIYFKRGVSLMDSLVRINLPREADRERVLHTLRLVGIEQLGGRPVDEAIQIVGEHGGR
ncbi:MAG: hypothetical protein EB084_06415 [Proteobacteria bacterium]|nr:hypothetical protein [Pseudomonadota bacterium]